MGDRLMCVAFCWEVAGTRNRCQVVPARSCTVYEKLLEGNAQQTGMDAPVAQVGRDDATNKKNAMGTQIRWFKSLLENLGLINGDLYAVSSIFPIQGRYLFFG